MKIPTQYQLMMSIENEGNSRRCDNMVPPSGQICNIASFFYILVKRNLQSAKRHITICMIKFGLEIKFCPGLWGLCPGLRGQSMDFPGPWRMKLSHKHILRRVFIITNLHNCHDMNCEPWWWQNSQRWSSTSWQGCPREHCCAMQRNRWPE